MKTDILPPRKLKLGNEQDGKLNKQKHKFPYCGCFSFRINRYKNTYSYDTVI